MSTLKKFAGQTAIYGISTIVSRLISSLLTPLYTDVYKPAAFGVFSTMFTYAALLNAFLAFGMETTFFRYLNKFSQSKRKVYNNGFWVVFMLSIFFMCLTLPFISTLANWIKIGDGKTQPEFEIYIKYFIGILVVDAWCVIPFAKIRADGRPIRYGSIKFINIITMIGLNLIFIYAIPYWIAHNLAGTSWLQTWFVQGWIGYVFLSNLVASIVTLLLLLPEILQLKAEFDLSMFKDMLSYSWPILIANLSFLINENIDKLMLGKLLPVNISDHEVGVYAACAKISIFLSIFINAFRLGAEPFFFSHSKNQNAGATYARIMNYFVIVVCVIFLGVVANIQILKYYIPNRSYWVGLDVVPPLIFGYVCLGIYMNLSVWYKLSDQTKYGLYISGAGAVLTIVLNLIFIPKYSYMASAWVSLAAYATMMILSYVWGQKNYPIPYNIKKNLAYIVASVVAVFLSFYVFHRSLIAGNLLLIAFAGATLFAERKELKQLLVRR